MAKAWLGIDWGTHSSKWCYQLEGGQILEGRIWDSRVSRIGDRLAIFPHTLGYRDDPTRVETALKRSMIQDPGQPFWSGDRPRLGVTLGQAVVFSIYALILDARLAAKDKGLPLPGVGELEIRFSHPNWMEPGELVALRYLRDAAVMAAVRVHDWPKHSREQEGLQIDVAELRSWATEEQCGAHALHPIPEAFDYDSYQAWSQGRTRDVSWRLVFESCAAGFSYLAEQEPGIFDPDEANGPMKPRKLLVVDIGAGSADAGYMLRTVSPKNRLPLLLWLPAAPTIEIAGRWLTDRIRKDWRLQGTDKSEEEVELYKTSGATEWHAKPYVSEWCDKIAEQVGDYMQKVPDGARLPRQPPLELAITGGSSAVIPVREAILRHVVEALIHRGVPIARTTQLIPETDGGEAMFYSRAEAAQRAVSRGAAHPHLVALRHYHQGL